MGGAGRNFRLLGHPVHAPFTHFPLALWTAGFGADLVFLLTQDPFWWRSAFWAIGLGLGLGSLTLLTGLLDYAAIPGLSREVCEKLTAIRPLSLGQASRIAGMTPAALSLLSIHLRRQGVAG